MNDWRQKARPAILVAVMAQMIPVPAGTEPIAKSIPIDSRMYIASTVYHTIEAHFAAWGECSREQFTQAYRAYLAQVARTDSRQDFALATMELVARLHNGHTWFADDALTEGTYGSLGFRALPFEGQWVVVRSSIRSLSTGDVITAIDGSSVEDFFAKTRRYISASSDRDARSQLFNPLFFPARFTVYLLGGSSVVINRGEPQDVQRQRAVTEGRWLAPGRVAYIRIPSFDGVTYQAAALEHVTQFQRAETLIVDVRNSQGGRWDPALHQLQAALMLGPFRLWRESSQTGAVIPPRLDVIHSDSGDAWVHPSSTSFKGRLLLLVDRDCASSCEDFVMPFKQSRRATLIGEATAGTFALTHYIEFGNGMRLNVAATREAFPDGAQFEGLGISPDVPVDLTIDDLKAGADPILKKALAIAGAE